MSAVVVTGASGLLGRALATRLARGGWEVRALVRKPAALAATLPGVRAAWCDLPNAIDESVLTGSAAVVHCAYATRETNLARARRVNEEGTRALLEASRRAGVPRFVFVSTVAAAEKAPNYYARSKYELERLLDPTRDLIVRPGLILSREGHGIFQQMRDIARRLHVLPLFGGGGQPLQTVHLDDLCEGIVRALDRGLTGALNVAEPDPPTMGDFLRMMTERMGVRCRFVRLPFPPVLAMLYTLEALRLPFPLRSESLLAIRGLQCLPVADDLGRVGLTVRTAAQSLADVL